MSAIVLYSDPTATARPADFAGLVPVQVVPLVSAKALIDEVKAIKAEWEAAGAPLA